MNPVELTVQNELINYYLPDNNYIDPILKNSSLSNYINEYTSTQLQQRKSKISLGSFYFIFFVTFKQMVEIFKNKTLNKMIS